MKLTFRIIVGLAALLLASGLYEAGKARTFTDEQGRKVDAEIVLVEGANVVLKLQNGQDHQVPLEQFSAADREFIRNWTQTPAPNSETKAAAPPAPDSAPEGSGGEVVFDHEPELPSSSPVGVANSRIWVPGSEPVRGMIVLVPGVNGDGRGAATNGGWQKLARELGFGLVGVQFKDKAPGAAVYCHADNGSGEALLAALEAFAKEHEHPEVEDAPLLL